MSKNVKLKTCTALISAVFICGCNTTVNVNSGSASGATNADASKSSAASSSSSTGKPDADGVISSGSGVEKEKPAAGQANVQGKVFYNEKPAEGIEVKLCETFSQFGSGCGGQTYTATTDANGEYLIKNVPPKTYEGLIAKVFDSDYYVFATSGFVSSAKYKVEPDKTFFAPDSHLFKSDLKLAAPKAGAKVGADNIEIKWEAYPDAAYYKFSIHPDSSTGAAAEYDFINKRVDGTSYVLEKPLAPGTYRIKVEAYNGNDKKLSQASDDIEFTVTG